MTIHFFLALMAFVTVILSAAWGRCPTWVPLLLMSLLLLMQHWSL